MRNAHVLVLVGAALVVAAATPLMRALAHRVGFVDEPGGQDYKWHTATTAYLGGVAILGAVLAGAFVGGVPSRHILVIALGTLAMGILGLWDDKRPVSVVLKIAAPALAAVALWISGVGVALTGIYVLDLMLTIIWVVIAVNSVNVIDNMNGVVVGLAALSSLAVLVISVNTGQSRVALLAAATLGGCLGFLPFNYPRASVFLGDAGTLPLGFVLAALTLALGLPRTHAVARLSIQGLILAIPLFNTALVSYSRLRRGKRVTSGGRDSVTYRLVALGLSRESAAIVIWLFAAALSGLSLVIFFVGESWAWVAIGLGVVSAAVIWRLDRVPIEGGQPPASGAEPVSSQ